MKVVTKIFSVLILIVLALPVVLLKGCGELDQEEACPATLTLYSSCQNFANDQDTITGPANDTVSVSAAFAGSIIIYTPLVYTVRDKAGPRNNVCVDFWTDGVFFADKGYTTPVIRELITLRTNDRGVICVYWGTEPVTGSGTKGQSFIHAISGGVEHQFDVDWSVE